MHFFFKCSMPFSLTLQMHKIVDVSVPCKLNNPPSFFFPLWTLFRTHSQQLCTRWQHQIWLVARATRGLCSDSTQCLMKQLVLLNVDESAALPYLTSQVFTKLVGILFCKQQPKTDGSLNLNGLHIFCIFHSPLRAFHKRKCHWIDFWKVLVARCRGQQIVIAVSHFVKLQGNVISVHSIGPRTAWCYLNCHWGDDECKTTHWHNPALELLAASMHPCLHLKETATNFKPLWSIWSRSSQPKNKLAAECIGV